MALYKNVAGQKIGVFAYDKTTGAAKTGDAANITGYLSLDFGTAAAVTDTNPTELSSANMPGWYVFDLTQAETNAESLVIAPKSSTSNIVIDQIQVHTADSLVATAAALQTVDDNVDAILADTNELQTDWVNGGRLDLILDARASQTSVDDLPTNAEFAARTLAAGDYFDPATDTVANVTAVGSVTAGVTVGTNNDKVGYSLSAAGVQAIWDAAVSALTTVGSIGKLLVDRIDAAITSRMATFSYTAPLDAAGTRAAVGLASANLDTQLGDLPTNSELAAAIAAGDDATLGAIGALNNLSAAEAQTAAGAALTAYDAATGADVSGISVPTATQIADAVLSRGVVNIEDTADAGSLAELLLGAFESAVSGTTWTIRKTGSGTFSTRTVATDPNADPIVSVT